MPEAFEEHSGDQGRGDQISQWEHCKGSQREKGFNSHQRPGPGKHLKEFVYY